MKFDTDERVSGAIPAHVRGGGAPGRQPRPWSRVARAGQPAWVLDLYSLLCMAGGLGILFLLWRAAAYLIRTMAGTSQ